MRAWEVVERNEMILAWHHAGGQPPQFEVPVLPEIGHPKWTPPRFFELKVPVHMQEMAENNCDPVHFCYVHSATTVPETEVRFSNHGCSCTSRTRPNDPVRWARFAPGLFATVSG